MKPTAPYTCSSQCLTFSIAFAVSVSSLVLDITQGELIQPLVAQPLPPYQNPFPSEVNPAAPFETSPSAPTDNPWKNVQVVRTLQAHSGTIDAIAFSPDNADVTQDFID
ncbi:MAG: hypothetical protein WBB28_08240 [Crinalium sp.]